ncbi:MAG: hypothetical protein RR700_05885 [Anaerorhabdus sp.]|uniref:hypothetical protein n=2 Tax=Anaerorhabdus sp. TaxID=1872524 RepID=UPI002FC7846D
MKKQILSLIVGIFFIFIANYIIQIKFYSFLLNIIFKLVLYVLCILLSNYLFSIKKDKYYIFKFILCVFLIYGLDNPKQRTIDLFNQRTSDFQGIQNIENAWMYTSMRDMNKSALFPIIDYQIVYAIEISRNNPIYLDIYSSNLIDSTNYDGMDIQYYQNDEFYEFEYENNKYHFYGVVTNDYLEANKLNLIR